MGPDKISSSPGQVSSGGALSSSLSFLRSLRRRQTCPIETFITSLSLSLAEPFLPRKLRTLDLYRRDARR